MWRAFFLWIALALTFATQAPAQSFPAYSDVYIDDFAGLLTEAEKTAIRVRLVDLYDKTGIEAVVVTMRTMRQYGHDGQIEPFATGLFNAWGVGDAARDDGVMVLVAKDDRQMRIELGSGYPAAMDAEMQRIIDHFMLPAFRLNRFGPGISAGVEDLVRVLEVNAGVGKPFTLWERAQRRFQTASAAVLTMLTAAGVAVLSGGLRLIQILRRRRPRFCPVDGTRMDLMDEVADDSRLQPGQTIEERLGSVDYDVWHCAACQHVTIESYRRWFSGYGACRSCNYRTLQGTTTIVVEASSTSAGLKRINYQCHNCGDNWVESRIIPQLSSSGSGSGSGSGRSSFGGGSSSGGGASGRW